MKRTMLVISMVTALAAWSCSDSGGCLEGYEMCEEVCTDYLTNPFHCGECGNACSLGETCVDGACQVVCDSESTLCGDACVDTDTNLDHCGACDSACPSGEVCVDGSCELVCGGSTDTLCGDACVDLNRNPLHCGACDSPCRAGEICTSGTCVLSCGGDTPTRCGDACVDTDTNPLHCGACDDACEDYEVCTSGSCETTCATGQIICDGACVNPDDDPAFCGATGDCTGSDAGAACADDEACVDGACVDLDPCVTHVPTGTPGITIGSVSATAVEGGDPVTYTVVLDADPCSHVIVTVAPDAQVTAVPTTLVFRADNWDTAQTVTVTAVHDLATEGDHTGTLGHTAVSLDPDYSGITIGDATVDISDRARLDHVSVPLIGAGSDDDSVAWSVSNDGRYVAFASSAANLVVRDSGSYDDVFVRDMTTGVTTRISDGIAGEANGDSTRAAMSNDGDRIAFFSRALNLVTDSITTAGEVYLYTQSTGALTLVSGQCTSCNTEIASTGVAVSGDGAFVGYSTRRMLVTADPETEYDVYIYNVATGATTLESLNSSDANGTFYWGSNCWGPTLSATGQFMGTSSAARNLDTPEITVENGHSYVKDRTGRTMTRVSKNSGGDTNCEGTYHAASSGTPFISSSGNLAVYYSACAPTLTGGEAADTNGIGDVFMRNISAETTTRLSISTSGAEADGPSSPLAISDDAQYVLFWSDATNLVTGDTNGATDLFIRDTVSGTTTRVSLDATFGEIAGGVETTAWMSRNGSWVVFATIDNLLSSDGNTDIIDVYLLQLR